MTDNIVQLPKDLDLFRARKAATELVVMALQNVRGAVIAGDDEQIINACFAVTVAAMECAELEDRQAFLEGTTDAARTTARKV